MQIEIASGHWIKLTRAGILVARADAYTDDGVYWGVRPPKPDGTGVDWSAPIRRVSSEEAAASVLAMLVAVHLS